MPGGAGCAASAGGPEDVTQGDTVEAQIKQAYHAGYETGYAACREDSAAKTEECVSEFRSMIDDLASQRKRLIKESEGAVLKVACDIARRIVAGSAEVREEVVLEVVKNALNYVADMQKVTIRVNPRDYEVLMQCESEWLDSARAGGVKISEDARIKPGGCLIEGESGSVEAQLDRQVDVIEKALLEAHK
jgi:flagellar biosynthesis/type III secretory pathway protein FliH